jgi:hypothetical protein
MAELTAEEKQVIEAYLSKEVALTQAQKKAVEDYLSNRSDLSRAEKTRINSYLRTIILSVLGLLGVTTFVALFALWNNMITNVQTNAQKEVVDNINASLAGQGNTLFDFLQKSGEAKGTLETQIDTLNESLSKAEADIATAQQKIDAALTGEVAQLGGEVQNLTTDIESIQDALSQITEGDQKVVIDKLEGLSALENRITDLQSQMIQTSSDSSGTTIHFGDYAIYISSKQSIAIKGDNVEIRQVDFAFPEDLFAEAPQVFQSIDVDGSGFAFAPYAGNYTARSSKEYVARYTEVMKRTNEASVYVTILAFGRAKTP